MTVFGVFTFTIFIVISLYCTLSTFLAILCCWSCKEVNGQRTAHAWGMSRCLFVMRLNFIPSNLLCDSLFNQVCCLITCSSHLIYFGTFSLFLDTSETDFFWHKCDTAKVLRGGQIFPWQVPLDSSPLKLQYSYTLMIIIIYA